VPFILKRKQLAFLPPLLLLIGFSIYFTNHKGPISEESITVTKQTGINEGQFAPDFELKTADGHIVRLSDYRGQKILLNFWASWCPPCKSEIPDLNEFHKVHKKENVTVLSINMTYAEKSEQSVHTFQDMYKINYPILLDESGNIAKLYGIMTIPSSYFIDANGLIHKRIIGPLRKENIENLIDTLD
jgi:peroxiredoxin